MKKFVRPTALQRKSGKRTVDFSDAQKNVPQIFDPGIYELTVKSAQYRFRDENEYADLVITESETGARVDIRPIWYNGPKANIGDLAVRHKALLGKLLLHAGQPAAGDPEILFPKLAGLVFTGSLVIAKDRTGTTFNALAEVLDSEISDEGGDHDD